MRIVLLIILYFSLTGISYSQNKTTQKTEAQKLINEAGDLIYKPGKIPERNNNLKQSISLAKNAIQLDTSRFVAYELLFGAYMMLKDAKGSINTCSEWLINHPNDLNVRLRRGVIYHRIQKQNLADKDFKFIKNGLVKTHVKVTNRLSEKDIASIVSNAYTYLLIGDRKTSLNSMDSLSKAFPANKKIAEANKEIQNLDIEKSMYETTGF